MIRHDVWFCVMTATRPNYHYLAKSEPVIVPLWEDLFGKWR